MDKTRLTPYQMELLTLIRNGNPDQEEGGPIDFDQLLELLSWKPTKASCHFSIRALIRRGFMNKTPELMLRRGRQRVGFELTQDGMLVLDPRGVEPEDISIPGVEKPDLRLEMEIPGLSHRV